MRTQRKGLKSVLLNWRNCVIVIFLIGFVFFLYMYYSTNLVKVAAQDDLMYQRVVYQECLEKVNNWQTQFQSLESEHEILKKGLSDAEKDYKKKILNLETTITEYGALTSEQLGKINKLTAESKTHTKTLTSTKSELDEKKKQISGLEGDLFEKDEQIERLEKELERVKKAAEEEVDVKPRDNKSVVTDKDKVNALVSELQDNCNYDYETVEGIFQELIAAKKDRKKSGFKAYLGGLKGDDDDDDNEDVSDEGE